MNYQFLKHPGYENVGAPISTYFSPSTAEFIRAKLMDLLRTVHPGGVIVPIERVVDLMNAVYEAYRPPTGDIYGRYTVPNDENHNMIDAMINQTITIAFNQIRDTLAVEGANSQLTVWTTVLGSFNDHGLRSHDVIKTRERHPRLAMFNMNY